MKKSLQPVKQSNIKLNILNNKTNKYMKTQKPKSLNDHKPLYYYTDNNIKLPKDYHMFNGLVIPLYGSK